ncbi:MAG TPA: hypothetical protein VG966_01870 [Hyphomicrobiaceae bacterium]|nr:hypothetical protein [Hyphomicrobiaceae bacterium]
MKKRHHRPFVHCAHCRAAHHWRGFVIELDDKDRSLALIGEDCGEKQFHLDFRRVERDFNAHRGRQVDLRQVIEIRNLTPAFEQELHALRHSSSIGAFDAYMAGLNKLGLRFVLQSASRNNNGVLTCVSYRRDTEAEEHHAMTLPIYKHHMERIAGAQTDYIRRTRIEEKKRWLDSLPRVEHREVEILGRVVGGGIFEMGVKDSLVAGMQAAWNLVTVQVEEFMRNRSDYWTKRRLTNSISRLNQGIELVYRALRLLNELNKFTSADNLATISKWSQREVELPQPRIRFSVKAFERVLIDENDTFRLTLPSNWAVPITPHMDALARTLGNAIGG